MMRNLRSASTKSFPLEVAATWLQKTDDPPWYSVQDFGNKGRGVVTKKCFSKDEFLLHYAGEVILAEEGEKREESYSSGYRFFFSSKGKKLCVDATEESGRLGRLVNHGELKERNCKMKEVDGSLFLFSTRDIQEGEELLYDYGLTYYPWKKGKKDTSFSLILQTESAMTPTFHDVGSVGNRTPVVMLSSFCDGEKVNFDI